MADGQLVCRDCGSLMRRLRAAPESLFRCGCGYVVMLDYSPGFFDAA